MWRAGEGGGWGLACFAHGVSPLVCGFVFSCSGHGSMVVRRFCFVKCEAGDFGNCRSEIADCRLGGWIPAYAGMT